MSSRLNLSQPSWNRPDEYFDEYPELEPCGFCGDEMEEGEGCTCAEYWKAECEELKSQIYNKDEWRISQAKVIKELRARIKELESK